MPRGRSTRRTTPGPGSGEPLATYREMRDFSRTPEPDGSGAGASDGPLTFVIQKHRATRLHYDLRLEVDGVMPSWPVPRGPSTDPGEKRMAVMTEEHPLDYATFEGHIPEGQYGAGEVIVWDRGTYSPDEDGLVFEDRDEANRQMREAITDGKISVTFRGHRMKGSWTLVRMNNADQSWLLLKHRDAAATAEDLAERYQDSVLTGLTIADLQSGHVLPKTEPPPLAAAEVRGATRAPMPAGIEPMQATQTRDPFDDPAWVFEPKLDGIRAVASLDEGKVQLVSRRGNDLTQGYPALAKALTAQAANHAIFDGEIVAFDEQGVPSFERLQQRMNLTNAVEIRQADTTVPVVYFVFDLLYLDGVDLRECTYEDRRRLLERTIQPSGYVQLVEPIELDGVRAFELVSEMGLEGLIAKRRDSRYRSGARSKHWQKVKRRLTDDFVVYGFTSGLNARTSTFGALLLATREANGELTPAGRVGGGFNDRLLVDLRKRLNTMVVAEPPIALPPALAREQASIATYVRPELVVEVEYTQVTSDGQLRAPVFLRLRDDKGPEEVRAVPVGLPAPAPAGAAAPSPGLTSVDEQSAAVLEQLETLKTQGNIDVGGARIRVSSLDKVMWPALGDQPPVTKRDLIAYYARMAPVLLRHMRDRPLTMTRYPNGIEGKFFYQKHVDEPPPFIETVEAFTETGGGDQQFLVVNNVATLVWLAQMADIALHTSLARVRPGPGQDGAGIATHFAGSREQVEASLLNYPDFLLFDLDPYIYRGDERGREEPELNRAAFEATCQVAGWLKELLDSAGMASFVKTSGATGLHIYVPLLREYDYGTIRSVAQTLGEFLVRAHPRQVTTEWNIEQRRGKVFFDANQNARSKNLAAAYSPRAKPGAPVSVPLRWNELGSIYPTDHTVFTAGERLERWGDLWEHILDAKQSLGALLALD